MTEARTVPDTAAWVSDPESDRYRRGLTKRCDICHVPAGAVCVDTIHPGQPLPGRAMHHGRTL